MNSINLKNIVLILKFSDAVKMLNVTVIHKGYIKIFLHLISLMKKLKKPNSSKEHTKQSTNSLGE